MFRFLFSEILIKPKHEMSFVSQNNTIDSFEQKKICIHQNPLEQTSDRAMVATEENIIEGFEADDGNVKE